MSYEKEGLVYRKKIRTYSKRLVTALSIASLSGYIAALALNISVLSLYFTIVSTILSALSFALNIWSLTDYFRQRDLNKQLDTSWQRKLMKICLDIASSVSFLIGGITSILPLEFPIIPFISTAFFILGCTFMATNFVRTMISQSQIDETKTPKLVNN
ncbi:Putative membrane protein [Wolbachia endosymbiont of Drosophila simulans wNo]|uniref:hypothetical protein n=1 Tax=unclassified Wolbachia TaxID=2640676 RepID=UPI0002D2544B|nr:MULTISPECIES: hypothetical protein [unclassified Wolbachia]AGJ98994.1 Putative membrane protein [Wolbachia endosymbiont of Drosophila simulans wNo]QCB62145.1 hypothetical protein EJA99_00245 [Wolbachia endosymbiont of Drosophila mauritiana]QCB63191.1 hypothetical protein EJB00_00245 [Wolbachia endosymbiont of Drosophila mauritiana]QWE33613.1 hypothetical protein WwMa_07230 [Wolbachia endosymbiont of Drosophila simulans]TGB07441.1 hypothetical protein E5C28_01205 [Wolbachia endosymbiont of D